MSYEEQIKAKHQFEDAYRGILQILSIMDHREIELVIAKIGDGIRSDQDLDKQSALLTARIAHMLLSLRRSSQLAQSQIMRVWMRRKKRTFAESIAERLLEPEVDRYKKEEARVKKIRAEERRRHVDKVWQWKRHVDAMPFWRRLFKAPPHPGTANLTAWPDLPMHPRELRIQIVKSKDFGEVLVEMAYHYRFLNIEYADEFVNEASVKSTTALLLEDKSK